MTTSAQPETGIDTAVVRDVVASEWIKLRSVRSTRWTIIGAALAAVGLGALFCMGYVARYEHLSPTERLTFDATTFSLSGLFLAQLAIGALGVLVISSEYSTGMIRTTFTAFPHRRTLFTAKAAVFAFAVLVIGELMSFAAFGIGQAILSQKGIGVSLGDPHVARAVVGGGLYLTGVGLLGVSAAALVRHTGGAMSVLFGLLFATSILVAVLPSSWRDNLSRLTPGNAGTQIMNVRHSPDMLGPWAGLLVLLAYCAALFALALWRLTRTDA